MPRFPSFSIITPSLNRAEFVAGAIESVRRQGYEPVEHLIIDGGSTDGTLRVIKKYPEVGFITETDRGLYEALNKGLSLARGDIIGFLNTDDCYEAGILPLVAQAFLAEPRTGAVVGRARVFESRAGRDIETIKVYDGIAKNGFLRQATMGDAVFNAWFFRKKLFSHLGGFNTDYRFASDREFLIRLALSGKDYLSFDRVFYNYRQHSESLTITGRETGESDYHFEFVDIAEKYLAMQGMPPGARRTILEWHSQTTADMALSALRKPRLDRAFRYAVRGLNKNKTWPLVLGRRAISNSIYLVKNRKQ